MTGSETSLLHRSGSEGGEPDHISHRVDIWHVRLILWVDFQESPLISLQTSRLDVEGACRAGPPDAVQRHLRNDLLATGEMDLYALAVLVVDEFNAMHLFAETQYGTLLVEMVGEGVHDFRVDEG